jgi:Na+/proline symporter
VLSCSAAITHDLLPHKIENTTLIKLMTVLITLGALGGALMNSQSVFSLVVMAWSGLASAFAPLLIILSLGKHPGRQASIIAIFTGLGVALLWRYLGWHNAIYEGLPGILSGLMVLGLALLASSGATAPSSPEKEARSSE